MGNLIVMIIFTDVFKTPLSLSYSMMKSILMKRFGKLCSSKHARLLAFFLSGLILPGTYTCMHFNLFLR